jgi:hypothetical protein
LREWNNEYDFDIYVKASEKARILANANFNLFDIMCLVKLTYQFRFNFVNLEGFDIKSSFKFKWFPCAESDDTEYDQCDDYDIFLEFNYFNFDYYDLSRSSSAYDRNPLRSCDEIIKNSLDEIEFVFKFDFLHSFLHFKGFINLFYKKNVLQFDKSNDEINSNIAFLYLIDIYHIDLDSKILDSHVFGKLRQ